MTKVRIDAWGIQYRKEMAETARAIIKERYIAGVQPRGCPAPPLDQLHLMPPPAIKLLDLIDTDSENIVLIDTADLFGIISLNLRLHSEDGELIESGEAFEASDGCGHWAYYLSGEPLASGTPVIVHAVASDSLGGVAARRLYTTIP